MQMDGVLWILAGGLVGLIAFAALSLNLRQGRIMSVIIGMVAAFFGGHMLAPVFGATVGESGAINPFALLVAAVTALGCLSISDMMHKRFGS
jgi:uncharacterized membrane protein YeaQ/YmgE (transglycosylase-associated protein family)